MGSLLWQEKLIDQVDLINSPAPCSHILLCFFLQAFLSASLPPIFFSLVEYKWTGFFFFLTLPATAFSPRLNTYINVRAERSGQQHTAASAMGKVLDVVLCIGIEWPQRETEEECNMNLVCCSNHVVITHQWLKIFKKALKCLYNNVKLYGKYMNYTHFINCLFTKITTSTIKAG